MIEVTIDIINLYIWWWIRQFLRRHNTAHAVTRAPWQKTHRMSEIWFLEVVCQNTALQQILSYLSQLQHLQLNRFLTIKQSFLKR